MSNPLTETELKSLLASTTKRMKFLAGTHPSMYAFSLTALAIAEGIDRNFGGGLRERLLGRAEGEWLLGDGEGKIELPAPATTLTAELHSTICRSCRTCSGAAFVPPKGLYGVDVHQAVNNQELSGRDRKCDSVPMGRVVKPYGVCEDGNPDV